MEKKSIKELIFEIKKRPAMYISCNNIFCLKAFLDGWYLMSPDSITDVEIMGGFQDWIVKKYKIKTSHSWADIIRFFSQDDGIALNNFFSEFDKFLETKKARHYQNDNDASGI
jgi:hypothetical protein